MQWIMAKYIQERLAWIMTDNCASMCLVDRIREPVPPFPSEEGDFENDG